MRETSKSVKAYPGRFPGPRNTPLVARVGRTRYAQYSVQEARLVSPGRHLPAGAKYPYSRRPSVVPQVRRLRPREGLNGLLYADNQSDPAFPRTSSNGLLSPGGQPPRVQLMVLMFIVIGNRQTKQTLLTQVRAQKQMTLSVKKGGHPPSTLSNQRTRGV